MGELRVQLDPLNPGQFYACCGLMELAALGHGAVLSHFESEPGRPRVSWFQLTGDLRENFLFTVLNQLGKAELSFHKGFEVSISPATLSVGEHKLELDWWLDEFRDKTVPLKCWAGQVTTRKLLEELLALLDSASTGVDLFQRSQLTKSKFGIDPRAAWNARDCGYSPNEHGSDSATFMAVEVLAAIGLQTFRPILKRRSRTVQYHFWTTALPISLARTASVTPWDGLPHRAFEFLIASRGQSYKYFKFAEPANKLKEKW